MILLLVASGRGVAVLPDWVVRSTARADMDIVTRPLARRGRPIVKRLYAATRAGTRQAPTSVSLGYLRISRRQPWSSVRCQWKVFSLCKAR